LKEPTFNERWLGAVCYLSVFVFVPIFTKNKSDFLVRHCRQGFALFFAEVVALLLLVAIEATIGQIPVLGLVVNIVLHLGVFLVFLAVSVIGFLKAVSGEDWRIPYLDELAEKLPIN